MFNNKLKYRRDFKFSYPYGITEGPLIRVLRGKYEGLSVHLESSHIESSSKDGEKLDHSLHFTYNIRKMWKGATETDEKKFTITSDDQKFIYNLIYNFIRETN